MSNAKPRSLSLFGIGALLGAAIALQGTALAAEDPKPAKPAALTPAALGLTTALTAPTQAEDGPQPSRKDTPEFLRPKEVALQAAVEPSEARPGDTVTYSVRAEIQEPWHIYAYSKEPLPFEIAATATSFDLFRLDGLEIDGDWTADREAHAPEEDSEVLVFDFYEGEVTWSIPLKVPADASAGEKQIASQIYFQICDPTSCKPPARVSIEPVSLSVVGGDGAAAAPQEPAAPATERPESDDDSEAGAPATTATAPVATGELQSKIDQGIIPFLIWSALGGVVALLMPCVWPMIPITVNFFVKQGQNDPNRSTTGLAVTYCLAIIAIFTLMGVIFSAVFGATSLIRLANAPWLNFLVAGLFIAFGLSLLGVFEIRLPSFLLNLSAKGESRGGLIGVIFMAITLTITSFTCTFPVVGALLVMAAGGSYLYPVVGLATFATVLALPFFLLALAPGVLKTMPKSGDWMNAVKVVGGLVEIGAAFKFLNTAEVSLRGNPNDAWFDAQVLMASWVVLALVCGLYLLGIFRTNHDHGETGVGPGRILTGTLFLGLALYFAPALFGYPPKSKIYDRLVVGLLPADAGELDAETQIVLRISEMGLAGPGDSALASNEAELETDPVRRARNFHGVWWGLSYDKAIERAKTSNKPILIDFTGVNCANCRLMEKSVMPRGEVVQRLRRFVPVQLYTDRVPADGLTAEESEQRAIDNLTLEVELTNQQTSPLYVILTPDEQIVALKGGYIEPSQFVEFLDQALAEYDKSVEVARASE